MKQNFKERTGYDDLIWDKKIIRDEIEFIFSSKGDITLDQDDFKVMPKVLFKYTIKELSEFSPELMDLDFKVESYALVVSSFESVRISDLARVISDIELYYGEEIDSTIGDIYSLDENKVEVKLFLF